jgi:membrane-bound metal-dependent hydrolase YbcI (DUF457 family)
MPGAIPHIIAGAALFIIGRYYFKSYFNKDDKSIKLFLLAFVCISFSIIPDFLLTIYYTTYAFSFCDILPYHNVLHIILFIIALVGLLAIKFFLDTKNKPIWIMGMCAILLHITMDLSLPDISIWI